MKKNNLTHIATQLTDGLLRNATDLVLFTFFLTLTSAGKSTSYPGIDQAFLEAKKLLQDINYKTLKQILFNLKHQQLVTYKRKKLATTLAITKTGKQRLKKFIPQYHVNRIWDKRIYLVTYDIPETQKVQREILRKYLKKLGAAMLQESVWVILYDPRGVLETFITEKNLSGVVIISNMGQDAIIGDKEIKSLFREIYHLDDLNLQYQNFIYQIKNNLPNQLILSKYFSVLKDDPQLPYELLPNDWLGDKAYKLCKKSVSYFTKIEAIHSK